MLAWIKPWRPTAAPQAVLATQPPTGEPAALPSPDPAGDREPDLAPPLLAWLLDTPLLPDTTLAASEHALLVRLTALADDPRGAAARVPRAAAVVPQLLRVLRDEQHASRRDWAERISRDAVLAAEVLRMAASARHGVRGGPAPLEDAVAALGVDGVRAAISQVVLRPVYQGAEGSLSQRAGARLWHHAQRQAWRCADLAAEAGVDAFEGYLAGLLHGTGWTLVLRTLDAARPAGPPLFSPAFAERAATLATRLYARVLADWRLAPALDALAAALLAESPGPASHPVSPLAAALQRSQRLATAELAAQGPLAAAPAHAQPSANPVA